MIKPDEGHVIAACRGKTIVSFGYFDGEDDWGLEEHACIYLTDLTLRAGMKEAKRAGLPKGADNLAAICMYL